jgi:S-disulfanyl-L-cysteine oxidoreductase SoxD
MRRHAASLVATCAAALFGVVAAAQVPNAAPSPAGRTVWDGVYTLTQAERGQTAYTAHCADCHRDDLSGYDSVLRGRRFMDKYREASLYLLFDKTKTTMPRNAAGSLSDETYVDILSYVLKSNEFPPGNGELSVEAVNNIRLVGKGGAAPVPDFSLIQVVGCLGRRDDAWHLTNTSDPVRTGHPQPDPEELAAARTVSTGTSAFQLMVSASYSPGLHDGRVVEVRGFLIRRPNDNRINVTSLETVGAACGP